jgi:hypothetical protein
MKSQPIQQNFTPVELETLLKCYYIGLEEGIITRPPSISDAILTLCSHNLVELDKIKVYKTTDRGAALVKLLCETPLPVEIKKWIDPRFEE